jgi:hypothetical protein
VDEQLLLELELLVALKLAGCLRTKASFLHRFKFIRSKLLQVESRMLFYESQKVKFNKWQFFTLLWMYLFVGQHFYQLL